MSILKVTEVKAGTELDGYDISYRVTVVAPGTEIDGTDIYSSSHPDKAVMKAIVKTAEDPFTEFTVKVDPAVATAAGVKNLERLEKSMRLDFLKQAINAEFDAGTAVEIIKATQG